MMTVADQITEPTTVVEPAHRPATVEPAGPGDGPAKAEPTGVDLERVTEVVRLGLIVVDLVVLAWFVDLSTGGRGERWLRWQLARWRRQRDAERLFRRDVTAVIVEAWQIVDAAAADREKGPDL